MDQSRSIYQSDSRENTGYSELRAIIILLLYYPVIKMENVDFIHSAIGPTASKHDGSLMIKLSECKGTNGIWTVSFFT